MDEGSRYGFKPQQDSPDTLYLYIADVPSSLLKV